MQDLGHTQFFQVEVEPETGVKVILSAVFEACVLAYSMKFPDVLLLSKQS